MAEPLTDSPSRWPIKLGVLGILMATLGFCCGSVFTAYPFLWPMYQDWLGGLDVPEPQAAKIEAVLAYEPPLVFSIVGGVVALGLAVVLLVGSIQLIRRRAVGATLCRTWGWITIPWTAASFVLNLVLLSREPEEVRQAIGGGTIGLALNACVVIVIGIAIPMFVILWLMRDRIKDEIAEWEGGGGMI